MEPQFFCFKIKFVAQLGLECDVDLEVYIHGHDLATKLDIISHEECRTECQATPGCTAWTWVGETEADPKYNNRCYLKGEGGAEAKRKSRTNRVTGLRECKSKKLI